MLSQEYAGTALQAKLRPFMEYAVTPPTGRSTGGLVADEVALSSAAATLNKLIRYMVIHEEFKPKGMDILKTRLEAKNQKDFLARRVEGYFPTYVRQDLSRKVRDLQQKVMAQKEAFQVPTPQVLYHACRKDHRAILEQYGFLDSYKRYGFEVFLTDSEATLHDMIKSPSFRKRLGDAEMAVLPVQLKSGTKVFSLDKIKQAFQPEIDEITAYFPNYPLKTKGAVFTEKQLPPSQISYSAQHPHRDMKVKERVILSSILEGCGMSVLSADYRGGHEIMLSDAKDAIVQKGPTRLTNVNPLARATVALYKRFSGNEVIAPVAQYILRQYGRDIATQQGLPLTKLDNHSIVEARQKVAAFKALNIDTKFLYQTYLPEFEKQALAAAKQTAVKDKTLFMVIGRPGSGKSTLVDKIAKPTGSLVLDQDDLKLKILNLLKELDLFSDPLSFTSGVKHGATECNYQLVKRVMSEGYNVITPMSTGMNNFKHVEKLLDQAHKMGYRTHVLVSNISVDSALSRLLQRFHSGRFTDLTNAIDTQNLTKAQYAQLKAKKLDSLTILDNSRFIPQVIRTEGNPPRELAAMFRP